MSRRVLVTGANGFVGRVVCSDLRAAGWTVRMAVRSLDRVPTAVPGLETCAVGDLSGATDWRAAVDGVEAIVHLAARVHQMHDSGKESLALYRAVNTDATLALAEAAMAAAVRRLVYVSTIKVNGETNRGQPFRSNDKPEPKDPYAISKFEAELGLAVFQSRGLEVAVVRPTLVYGPGVRANFERLMKLARSGIPVPLGAVRNRRSLVSVWNLSSLIGVTLDHPRAPGRVWLVSDGADVSTAELLRVMAAAVGRRARLFPVPVPVLYLTAQLFGRSYDVSRLTESLQVEIEDTRALLGWAPPVSLDEGIRRTMTSLESDSHA